MDKLEMTPEQQLAFDGFIDVMVQIYKMTSDKIDYSKMFVDENDILPYVRRTLGISQLSINAYVNLYKEKGYNSLQVNYIRNLLLFLSQNGTIEKGDLLNPDLDFDGIFDSKQINDVMDEIIKRI